MCARCSTIHPVLIHFYFLIQLITMHISGAKIHDWSDSDGSSICCSISKQIQLLLLSIPAFLPISCHHFLNQFNLHIIIMILGENLNAEYIRMVQKYNLLVICLCLTYVIFYKVLCSPCCLLIVILLCYLVHPSLVLYIVI